MSDCGRTSDVKRIRLKGNASDFSIGSFCAIGSRITVICQNHDYEKPSICVRIRKLTRTNRQLISKGPVIIKNDVWLGDQAVILSGVTIEDGAIVGAGAVVTKSCDPYTINVGVPARPIKKRFRDDIIEWLLELRWWDWDDDRIRRNSAFFRTNLNKHELPELRKLVVK